MDTYLEWNIYQWTPNGRRRGRPKHSWKNQMTDFMRSRNLDEDRHLWRLGVDGWFLVVQILIINYYCSYCCYYYYYYYYSRLLPKNLKIKIYKTIIMPVVLYGCEAWSLTLREECRLRVFEKRILSEYLGPRGMRMGSGEGYTMRNFIVCTVHLIQSR